MYSMKSILLVSLTLMAASLPAWAALGQYESSVSLDQKYIPGEDRQEVRQGYHLHQITAADGSYVREYVAPSGIVFGVSWQGHGIPNLQQLLGSHITDLEQAPRRVVPRRSLMIKTDTFVFVSSGHLRMFQGHAYVPNLMPSNLGPEVVQ
jgi:hypothetical protein